MENNMRNQSLLILRSLTILLLFVLSDCYAQHEQHHHNHDRHGDSNNQNYHRTGSSNQNHVYHRESIDQNHVIMENELVQVTLSRPDGNVVGIKYNGINNLLETHNYETNRGYWDIVWNRPGQNISLDRLRGTKYKVVVSNKEQVELSFIKTWTVSDGNKTIPLNVDKRYVIRRGVSGFYTYAIFERLKGFPAIEMSQMTIVFKLSKDKFHSMAVSDTIQTIMPMPQDRETGQRLNYDEAILLTNPINPRLKGEVDDKYQYTCEIKDNKLHGWVSTKPTVGFWMITPSDEFRTGGPLKQVLTSHVGPTTLASFASTHYVGSELVMKFEEGEAWKKTFGPFFIYLNSDNSNTEESALRNLWKDAKNQTVIEVNNWPYNFPQSEDFPSSNQRGRVTGQLLVHDSSMKNGHRWANAAFIGLAAPGEAGAWQTDQCKGYQFWTRGDKQGHFSLENIRVGIYNLYAWVPGILGDYKYEADINIEAGTEIDLDRLIFNPPRVGPTLWEIGFPDRSAAEFYIPDPYPKFQNPLFNGHQDKFRQYGLWERYADLYPNNDLIYTVGLDDYRKDWFYAQVTRDIGNKTSYAATTWQVRFQLANVKNDGIYTLHLALAAATDSNLQVRFNNPSTARRPLFATGRIGKDNAIARHGIHGRYWHFSVQVPGHLLKIRNNILYLTQGRHSGPFSGIMYDYIRLEAPPSMVE